MSVKEIDFPDIGVVKLYKRRGSKTMRLSITHEGEVRLTMPKWTPFSAGIVFVNNNVAWINDHRDEAKPLFRNNLRVGKAHTLTFSESNITKPTSRINQSNINIILPMGTPISSSSAQKTAKNAAQRALKKEAESLLPQRLKQLADKYGFEYSNVSVKHLKSRWGSCNNLKQISLSYFLMQLPWDLIDYVILHELTHTKVLAHGPKFWTELESVLPNARVLKKDINKHKPTVDTSLN